MRGKELFWGGAICWWGGLRAQLTPDLRRSTIAHTAPSRV